MHRRVLVVFVCAIAATVGAQERDWISTGGPDGGEIVSFGAVDGVVLAGGAAGMARSLDGGLSWELVDDLGGLPAVTSFATIGGRVLAADVNGGLFASDDAGETWIELDAPAPGESGVEMRSNSAHAYLISVDLSTQTEGRLWTSDDAGESWVEILLPTTPDGRYGAISMHAAGERLLVSTTEPGSNGFLDAVLRSPNRGESWEVITEGVPVFAAGVRPIEDLGDTLFAGTGNAGALRSDDDGRSWRLTEGVGGHPAPPSVNDLITLDGSVYFVGTKLDGGQDDVGPGLWRSDDLGQTWQHRDAGLPGRGSSTNDLFAAGGTLLIGTRFHSLWMSEDEGATWSKSVEGIALADVFALAAGGETLFATPTATQEVWRNDGDGWMFGQTPSTPGDAFGQVLELHTDGSSIVFAGTQGDGIYRSLDGGETFETVNAGVPQYNGTAGLQFREIEAFDGSGQTIFAGSGVGIEFAGGRFLFSGGGALRSDDGGQSWRSINSGLPIIGRNNFFDPIFDPILAIHQTDDAVFAGHFLGSGIFRSVNGGQSWSPANTGLPAFPEIRDIESFAGSVFAAGVIGNTTVWRSDDGGDSWASASQGLPFGRRARSLTVAGDVLYVGIEDPGFGAGVYESVDGATWTRVGEALDGVSIRRLAARDDGTVAAGTFDRSVWILTSACDADIDGDGDTDAEDFFGYLDLFAAGDDRADIDGDGDLDGEDFFGYLDLFAAGC